MAQKKNRKEIIQRLAIGVGVLVLIQIIVLVFFGRNESVSPQVAIDRAVEKRKDLDAARKTQLRIQLALADYRDQKGKYPDSLNQLIPDYFTSVPLDPTANKPFTYKVEGGKYQLIGEVHSTNVAGSVNTGGEQVVGDTKDLTDDQRIALVKNLDQPVQRFVYDPSGKRDPFRPFDFAPKSDDGAVKTELETYLIGQLKLTAILDGFDGPIAMVENEAGKGFRLKKGVKVGPNGGEVVEILKDKVLILESSVDFTGQKTSKTIEIRIRTKDQETQAFPSPR